MNKKVLITGIAGQDGSYLSEYLLELGYEVHGIIRRQSTPEHQESRIDHLNKHIKTYYGDLTDYSSLIQILATVKPDYIYNLAAMSHVRISFDIPQYTAQVNALGVLNLLEAFRVTCPQARVYQASSSEMIGNSVDSDGFQRITTPMHPVSPYGCAKLFAYNLIRHYREAHKYWLVNGVLFNHDSPRRGSNFVTSKVAKGAVMIKYGLADKLELGNLDSYRDWGHSKDYVVAIGLLLTKDGPPEDMVVATGVSRSVRDLCNYVFNQLGLSYEDYVVQNQKYLRPEELKYLCGDSSVIREKLGWQPEYTFEQMMDEIIEHWDRIISSSLRK